MPLAYPLTKRFTQVFLSREEAAALFYHDIFEYPLTMAELVKWSAGPKAHTVHRSPFTVSQTNGFYHLATNPAIVLKRLMRRRISARKIEIAKKAAKAISVIPTIKMVATTGALAMENAADESDIDLMIVTKKGTLWTSRLLTYLVLRITNNGVRRPAEKNQKDKLCLNMWIDESDLLWHPKKRNIYTAHEIAQALPLINRAGTHEKLIAKNDWIRGYWPNAVRATKELKKQGTKELSSSSFLQFFISFVEKTAFKLQYAYMKKRITRETVTATRAFFHPVDWSRFVIRKLST